MSDRELLQKVYDMLDTATHPNMSAVECANLATKAFNLIYAERPALRPEPTNAR